MKKTLSIFGVMVVVAIFSNKLSAQECVTCDDTRQSVSIGFDNNLNLKHHTYLLGENINCISDNAVVIGQVISIMPIIIIPFTSKTMEFSLGWVAPFRRFT